MSCRVGEEGEGGEGGVSEGAREEAEQKGMNIKSSVD